MFDLDEVLKHIALDDSEMTIDHGFIVDFLAPYYPHLKQGELESLLLQVILAEMERTRSERALRKTA